MFSSATLQAVVWFGTGTVHMPFSLPGSLPVWTTYCLCPRQQRWSVTGRQDCEASILNSTGLV